MIPPDNPFSPELRTMAFVPRWSILWTTATDTIASHTFFVAMYAYMIAYTIQWKGSLELVLLKALFHDLDETITGDIVGPAKKHIVDRDHMASFVDAQMDERYAGMLNALYDLEDKVSPKEIEEAEKIIAAADVLDALLFLILEQRRGNSTVAPVVQSAEAVVEAKWRDLPAPQSVLDLTWQTVALPAIKDHWDLGGRGVRA